MLSNTEIESTKWDQALLSVQKSLLEGNIFLDPEYQIKEYCHVRYTNLPKNDPGYHKQFPTNEHSGDFVQIKGNVIRMTQVKCLEYKRDYECKRCKKLITVEGEYHKFYVIEPPQPCRKNPQQSASCRGTPKPVSTQPNPEYCMDIQEIRLQELVSDRNMPSSIIVSLENDMVEMCQPGDCVTIWYVMFFKISFFHLIMCQ